MINLYVDGGCKPDRKGGWGAIILEDGKIREIAGKAESTTSNRMEIMAAIQGLNHIPPGSEVTVHSDSQYLVNTMTSGWKRRANLDLWVELDRLVQAHRVNWEWLPGHIGHPYGERAHLLADRMAGIAGEEVPQDTGDKLTHVDSSGQARMVDISGKLDTEREAEARGRVVMEPGTFGLLQRGEAAKGDVLAVARLAGIMAAKQTPYLIPLCHPILITEVSVQFQLDEEHSAVEIIATARTDGKTGVEMEAMTAVAISALTIYDMLKAVDRGIRIEEIRLTRKSGGKSGTIILE